MDRLSKGMRAVWLSLFAVFCSPCPGFGYEHLSWSGLEWTVGAGSARVDEHGSLVLSAIRPGGEAWVRTDLSVYRGLTQIDFSYLDPGMNWRHANALDLFINFGSDEERIEAGSGLGLFPRFHGISFLDENPTEIRTRYLGLRRTGWLPEGGETREPFVLPGLRGFQEMPPRSHAIHLYKDEDGLVFYDFDRRLGVSSFLRNDEDEGPWGFDTVTIRLRDADRDARITGLQHNGSPNPIPGGLWLLGSALIGALGLKGLARRKRRQA